jgi:lipopolysaccharide export system protein LptC
MQTFFRPIARYTRFVLLGKRALWTLSAVLFLGLIAWAWTNSSGGGARVVFSGKGTGAAVPTAMLKPRYQGVDAQNRPFTVIADEALQPNNNTVELKHLSADMMTESGRWLALTSEKGTYTIDAKHLTLEQDVHLFYDGGYEFRTEFAEVDINAGTASGDKPVQGQGPGATLQANHFHVLERGAILRFNDSVKVTLYL